MVVVDIVSGAGPGGARRHRFAPVKRVVDRRRALGTTQDERKRSVKKSARDTRRRLRGQGREPGRWIGVVGRRRRKIPGVTAGGRPVARVVALSRIVGERRHDRTRGLRTVEREVPAGEIEREIRVEISGRRLPVFLRREDDQSRSGGD